eukprot:scaffold27330_cov146-Isochrysis_galbana.AAC.2
MLNVLIGRASMFTSQIRTCEARGRGPMGGTVVQGHCEHGESAAQDALWGHGERPAYVEVVPRDYVAPVSRKSRVGDGGDDLREE